MTAKLVDRIEERLFYYAVKYDLIMTRNDPLIGATGYKDIEHMTLNLSIWRKRVCGYEHTKLEARRDLWEVLV